MSAARDTRVLCAPVTVTTGVRPRRPQVRPFGGRKPWPDSSSKISQAPRSAAVLLPPATSPAARPRSALHPARRPAGPGSARSSRSGAAADPRPPGCNRPGTVRRSPQRSAPASSTDPHPTPTRPALPPGLSPAHAAGRRSACTSPRPRLSTPAPPGRPRPGPRRHRFADILDTRNRRATSRSLAPSSISSAAANRTCSRRARSPASSPPPSGYLIPMRYRSPRQPSAQLVTPAVKDR
jgi:hypothetical protein